MQSANFFVCNSVTYFEAPKLLKGRSNYYHFYRPYQRTIICRSSLKVARKQIKRNRDSLTISPLMQQRQQYSFVPCVPQLPGAKVIIYSDEMETVIGKTLQVGN